METKCDDTYRLTDETGHLYTGVLCDEALSHFVKKGAHRLNVSKGNNVLAFKNPDGQVVILCANKDTEERNIRIACKGHVANVKLAPKTFNTITL